MKNKFFNKYWEYVKFTLIACAWSVLFIYLPYLLTNKYERILITIAYLIIFMFIIVPFTTISIEQYVMKEIENENSDK